MDAAFGGLVVLELACSRLYWNRLWCVTRRGDGLDYDRFLERRKTQSSASRLPGVCVVVENPCVVAGSDDPRSMMIPPKRRRVVSFYVVWIISFESNSEGYENPGFGCCPGMNYIFFVSVQSLHVCSA